MELETTILPEDFKALQKDLMKRIRTATGSDSKGRFLRPLFFFLMVFILAIVLKAAKLADFTFSDLVPSLIIATFFVTIFLVVFFKRISQYSPSENGLFLGKQRLRISPEAIEQEGELFKARYEWPLLEDVTETRDHFILYLDRVAGIVVPKKSFTAPNDSRIFIDKIREYAPHITR